MATNAELEQRVKDLEAQNLALRQRERELRVALVTVATAMRSRGDLSGPQEAVLQKALG